MDLQGVRLNNINTDKLFLPLLFEEDTFILHIHHISTDLETKKHEDSGVCRCSTMKNWSPAVPEILMMEDGSSSTEHAQWSGDQLKVHLGLRTLIPNVLSRQYLVVYIGCVHDAGWESCNVACKFYKVVLMNNRNILVLWAVRRWSIFSAWRWDQRRLLSFNFVCTIRPTNTDPGSVDL